MKEKRHRRSRHSSSSSSKMESNVEAFYIQSRGRREKISHRARNEDKIYKHNVTFPTFNGDSNPNEYKKWERKVSQIVFTCGFLEKKIVKLIVLEFEGYALSWWNKYQHDIIDSKHHSINSWDDLEKAMRKRFMPSTYKIDLILQLQRLKYLLRDGVRKSKYKNSLKQKWSRLILYLHLYLFLSFHLLLLSTKKRNYLRYNRRW